MIELLESKFDSEFLDKYFPRIDFSNPRYKKYKYKGRMFAYDTKDSLVLVLFQDDDELKELGKSAPWREMDAAGLSASNWRRKEVRNEYLDGWIFDISEEASYLAQDFIDNELPLYQKENNDRLVDDTYGNQVDVVIYLPYYDDDEDMKYFTIHVDADSDEEAIKKANKYIKNKKTSKNSRIWKDAKVDHIKEI